MKDVFSYEEIGERFDNYALPWDQVNSSSFTVNNPINVADLAKNSQSRMAQNKFYQLLLESAQWRKIRQRRKDFS